MKTVKGPAIFLAQFAGDQKPFNQLETIAKWAAGLGFKGIQIPSWDQRLFNLKLAAESQDYCDQILGMLKGLGLELTELSTHLQGQLVAVHPAYDLQFDGFAAPEVAGNPKARQEWAVKQVLMGAKASRNLKLTAHATFSGALAWPYMYPWPQRPAGLVEEAFAELGRRWRPILDALKTQGLICVLKSIPEKTCTMESPSNVFSLRSVGIRERRSCTIPAISCCSSWTILPSSTSTMSASVLST
jgi:sugar phosphate isomerase/epimerase